MLRGRECHLRTRDRYAVRERQSAGDSVSFLIRRQSYVEVLDVLPASTETTVDPSLFLTPG